MPKVTVIMPSLNVIKYIRPCMESVLAQTLQDIEILAIDAGSNDGTLEILREYAAADKRVKVILSDKKSYGYQLNKGIALAGGEYVGVVETDDMIAADMYEILYGTAVKLQADYVKGSFEKFVEIKDGVRWCNRSRVPLADMDMVGRVIEPRNMPEIYARDIYLWTGIYRKDFISQIVLNETYGAAFQDQGFLFQTISLAKKAVYLDRILYRYRQDNGSSSIFNRKGFQYLVGEYAYIERFLKDMDISWYKSYFQRMFNQCVGRFEIMAVSGSFWNETIPDIEILRAKLIQAVKEHIIRPEDMSIERCRLLELFLQGAEDIYSYCKQVFQKKEEKVCDVLQIIRNRKTIIFGSGRYGKFFHALLECKHPGVAVAYCDNNLELWNTQIQGIPVLSPEETVEQYPDAVYVIANLKSAAEIKQQLRKLEVADSRICIYQETPDLLLFKADFKIEV